jgi:queuine tRNA-ribosyltransferase
LLHTPHGVVETPTFMPVGTLGSVKALTPADVRATGAQVVLSNSYHLSLQPGVDTVQRLGGVHGFMRWDGPMLTDSGGFQVFSLDPRRGRAQGGVFLPGLGRLREVSDEGVTFASHLNGTLMLLSPECVVEAQERLGADLIMPLDECLGAEASRTVAEEALDRTQRWWRRSLAARRRDDQALFALVQGGLFADLRRQAARAAGQEPAPGFAIGGLSVGEPKSLTAELLAATLSELPTNRPRYLMGVGHPKDLVTYARLGVDLFDCVLPTRLGRNGTVWADAEGTRLNLGRRSSLAQRGPIIDGCTCTACTNYSVGSLAALYQNREPLVYRLASVHNLTLPGGLLHDLRRAVLYTATHTPMVPEGFLIR